MDKNDWDDAYVVIGSSSAYATKLLAIMFVLIIVASIVDGLVHMY